MKRKREYSFQSEEKISKGKFDIPNPEYHFLGLKPVTPSSYFLIPSEMKDFNEMDYDSFDFQPRVMIRIPCSKTIILKEFSYIQTFNLIEDKKNELL